MVPQALRSWVHTARVALRNVQGRKHEPEMAYLDRFIVPGEVCLHVGASDGRHTYVMSRLAGSGVIHCFEPSTYTHRILSRIVRLHGLSNVRLNNVAIGEEPGEMTLVTPVKRNGHLGRSFAFITSELPSEDELREKRQFRGFEVAPTPVWTLDGYCESQGVTRVGFIRCDVEGAELSVLRGARRILERDRPPLLLEIHPHALRDQFDTSAGEVEDLLRDLGYRLFRVGPTGLEEASEVEDEPWRDYFCVPPDHPFALAAAA